MLSLVSGHYPAGPGQVAVTDGVASAFGLKIGDVWHQGGTARRVTGIVENPQSLLDEFRPRGAGPGPHAVSGDRALRRPRGEASSLGPNVQTRAAVTASNPFNPETIVLALATVGMLLIAPGVRRRIHGAGAAPAAFAGDARRRWGDGPERPSRRPGQRDRGGGRRHPARCRHRPGRVAGLPAARRGERPPRDRRVPAAVGRDRRGDGAGPGGHLLRRLPARPVGHPGAHRDGPVRAAGSAQADPPLGGAGHRSRRRSPRPCSRTAAAKAAAAECRKSSSAWSPSSPP